MYALLLGNFWTFAEAVNRMQIDLFFFRFYFIFWLRFFFVDVDDVNYSACLWNMRGVAGKPFRKFCRRVGLGQMSRNFRALLMKWNLMGGRTNFTPRRTYVKVNFAIFHRRICEVRSNF